MSTSAATSLNRNDMKIKRMDKMSINQLLQMSMDEMVSFLEIVPAYNTYIYIDTDGFLCAVEKRDTRSYPADEMIAIGYVRQAA